MIRSGIVVSVAVAVVAVKAKHPLVVSAKADDC